MFQPESCQDPQAVVAEFLQRACPVMCDTCVEGTIPPSTSTPRPTTASDSFVQNETCAYRGKFNMKFAPGSGKRFSGMLDPAAKIEHSVPAAAMAFIAEDAYAAQCVCACDENPACVAAAVRTTGELFVCYLSSSVGDITDTVLDVASFTRATSAGTCPNLLDGYGTVQDAMSLLANYNSPIVGMQWGIPSSLVIFESNMPSISSRQQFDAKVDCLHKCCSLQLCSAAHISEEAGISKCTIIASGDAGMLDIEGMRVGDQGSSAGETIFYSRSL